MANHEYSPPSGPFSNEQAVSGYAPKGYGRAPENWLPEYAHIEAIRKAEAVAQIALGFGDTISKEARNLATMMGVDYREITGRR